MGSVTPRELEGTIEALQSAQSLDDIQALCQVQCQALGFDRFIFAMRVPVQFAEARLLMINGYPPGWVEHYFERGYAQHDPVMAHCASHVTPLAWHDLDRDAKGVARQVMGEAGEVGLRDGVTAPVHSPHGEMGVLSFALDGSASTRREVVGHSVAQVQMLSVYVHETVRRVAGLSTIEPRVKLSIREEDCLRWAADGKTSWEIAQILKLSERNVNFHLNNAVQKLDARNRQHAVAKAALQGLVQPWPF